MPRKSRYEKLAERMKELGIQPWKPTESKEEKRQKEEVHPSGL